MKQQNEEAAAALAEKKQSMDYIGKASGFLDTVLAFKDIIGGVSFQSVFCGLCSDRP